MWDSDYLRMCRWVCDFVVKKKLYRHLIGWRPERLSSALILQEKFSTTRCWHTSLVLSVWIRQVMAEILPMSSIHWNWVSLNSSKDWGEIYWTALLFLLEGFPSRISVLNQKHSLSARNMVASETDLRWRGHSGKSKSIYYTANTMWIETDRQ